MKGSIRMNKTIVLAAIGICCAFTVVRAVVLTVRADPYLDRKPVTTRSLECLSCKARTPVTQGELMTLHTPTAVGANRPGARMKCPACGRTAAQLVVEGPDGKLY